MLIRFRYDGSGSLTGVRAIVRVGGDICYDFEMKGVYHEGPSRTILDTLEREIAECGVTAVVEQPGVELPA